MTMPNFLPVCEPLLAGNELKYVADAVTTGWLSSSGSYVAAFEETFAEYCGARHAIAVCNGTVALHLALRALGVGPGDEVIIPDFTMIASALAISYCGAKPVFVDADAVTWNIDAAAVEQKINPATKGIMAVHIFGNPCDMATLQQIADRHGLWLMEDAAEAHGARFQGRRVGSLSRIAGFSFFANKNITTGEGGMVVTNDDNLAHACRYFKNMCFPLDAPRAYLHADIGYNYRMSNLHAAIGLAQTERADVYKALRQSHGRLYRQRLSVIPGILLQQDTPCSESVNWMNGLALTPEYGRSRGEVIAHLRENNIDSRLFFNGMHRQPALKNYGCACDGSYPVADMLADNGFYLPSGSGLQEADIERVCSVLAEFRR